MPTKTRDIFTTVTIEGALLPPDILQRVTDGDSDLDGLHPEAYHLYGERLNEATNRAWNRLQGAWQAFKQAQERLPEDDLGTTITRERWLMILFNVLDYGRLESATAIDLDGKSYAISHRYKSVPIHLLSYKVDLDSRTKGVAGAAAGSPHSMMQVLLNRMDEHLWGILSNGYQLRILRDNLSLTRQAYIEFDLQAMMEGEVYSDFVLLYLLCHQSRVEQDNPNAYWLENWRKAAEEQGKRALEDLRIGVERAINCLGMGFLDHPHNTDLRDALSDGSLDKQDYYRELLRLVYRMLFLFVAEDRDLLHLPDATDQQRAIFQHYSTNKLRDLAANLRGTRHHDLYESLRLVMRLLGGSPHPLNPPLPNTRSSLGEGDFNDSGSNPLPTSPEFRGGANSAQERASLLGLPVLGSFLFSADAMQHISDAKIANRDLLEAVRAVSTVADHEIRRLRRVNFKNLGSEELGSVYESLLELHPDINLIARTFDLKTAGGNERKTTGSYYTPTSLINALLDSALDPVLDEAIGAGGTRAEIEERLLELKVVDPACGSGHFLIAAANRMAKRLASVRTGEDEPTPEHITQAKRDVIANCIYGVDLNEMAVELCKVNLWLESIDPGKPLTFLDSRIQHGNSLLGTTPALMARGIPDDAFPTKSGLIEGDQNKIVSILRKQNRNELKDRQTGQKSMFSIIEPPTDYTKLSRQFQQLAHAPDDTLSAVRTKERLYRALAQDPEYVKGKFLADLWCGIFVWMKAENATYTPFGANGNGIGQTVPAPPTDLLYRNIEDNPLDDKWTDIRAYTAYLADRYDFFHWHIAFPEVFNVKPPSQTLPPHGEGLKSEESIQGVTGWEGGFDVVLGNPPWERIKLQEKEWFAERVPEIASAANASARKKMIKALQQESPQIYADFLDDLRKAASESYFIRYSDHYPLCGRGDINTYAIFAEIAYQIQRITGQVGIIVPTVICSNDTTKYFFNEIMKSRTLVSLYSFYEIRKFFPSTDDNNEFCLLTLSGTEQLSPAQFAFTLHDTSEIADGIKSFSLSADDVSLLNPNTGTMATFGSNQDAIITKAIYQRIPVIFDESQPLSQQWDVGFSTMFHMSGDSDKFKTSEELHHRDDANFSNQLKVNGELYLPLYEAKMMHQYTHRWGSYASDGTTYLLASDDLSDPFVLPLPRYWVKASEVHAKDPRKWFLAFREIVRSNHEHTMICSILPRSAIGNKAQLISVNPLSTTFIQSNLNAFVLDYVTRQKLTGSSLSLYIVKQLPVIPPHTYTQALLDFIVPRVLELTYTAWDLQAFAQDVGYGGAPFVWDDERRFWLRAELDALYFHLYGIERDDVDYIMETFPIVKRKDIKATASPHPLNPPLPTTRSSLGEGDFNESGGESEGEGYYRTKLAILEIYDEMANLPTMDVPAPKGNGTISVPDVSQYQPALSPPPASPEVAHEDRREE